MKDLLNKLQENGMIWCYLCALISSDNLSNVEDCNRSIMLLNDTIKSIPETEFSDEDKEKIIQYCKDSIEICEHDKKLFLTNIN